jgi:8-oxo-dGTP diphosphatase
MIETVLVYIEKHHQYLLIHKKKKDMNEGKYLGIGGKIESNESIVDALLRETYEETGLRLLNHRHRANIYFKSGMYQEKMYLFTASIFEGNLSASPEGDLVWVDKTQIKSLPMWVGDHYFLEKLDQTNDFFEMHLVYEGETLIDIY